MLITNHVLGGALVALACLVAVLLTGSVAAATFLAVCAGAALLPAGRRRAAILHSPVWDAWRRRFRYCGVVPAGRYWKTRTKYDVAATAAAGAAHPAAQPDEIDSWDRLSRGDDPT